MNKLFLHFGPGGSPLSDKEVLSNDSIYFWQQPFASKDEEYIPNLLNSTENEIEKLYKKNGPIEIVAHSFGALIAMNLSAKAKKLICKYTFLAPTFNVLEAFTNIATHVAKDKQDKSLEEMATTAKNSKKVESFWKMFQTMITNYPDFMSYYWVSEDKFKEYLEIASKYPALNEETAFVAINELIQSRNHSLYDFENLDADVKIIIGNKDPLITDETRNKIINFFGEEKVTIVKAGHFPHFENTITI